MKKVIEPIFCDFETQSGVPITNPDYITHSTTRYVSFAWWNGKSVSIYVNPNVGAPAGLKISNLTFCDKIPMGETKTFCAHNAEMFDARIFERFFYRAKFVDTLHLCRLHGLPGSLKEACAAFGLEPKENQDIIKKLCAAKYRKGKLLYPTITRAEWEEFFTYARQDVVILRQLWHELQALPVTDFEREVIVRHQEINQRGYRIDVERANILIRLWSTVGDDAREELKRVTNGKLVEDDIRSPQKVKSYLESIGCDLPTLDKRYVDQLLAGEVEIPGGNKKTAELVLTIRKLGTRTGASKIASFLDYADKNDIVRNTFIYHGANTGRWSGTGPQPHNITKGHPDVDIDNVTMKSIQAEARRLKISNADVLSSLTRGVIVPRPENFFGIADFAAIEARGVAWFAECDKMLDAFRNNKDIYCEFGSELFGRTITKTDKAERHVSKQIVLGCGYQMGANKFEMMCKQYHVDLSAVGLTGKACVDAYRKAYPEIANLWYRWQRAAFETVRDGREREVCNIVFECDGVCLSFLLPSGRRLRYWNPEVRDEYPKAFDSKNKIPHLYYQHPRYGEKNLYGGIIAENIVQATCRDILAHKLIQLDNVVLHVHDEIVCELKNDKELKNMARVMGCAEDWYSTFPITSEVSKCERYTK